MVRVVGDGMMEMKVSGMEDKTVLWSP